MKSPDAIPTLEQVAALAGVGRGTASRVVNGSDHVSEQSRQRVLAAVAELGYVPNHAARTLKTRRTDTVALVIAEDEERIFSEPFFAEVVRSISRAVDDASRRLVLTLVHGDQQAERLSLFLSPQHVDGVIMLSMHDGLTLPREVTARGLPVVVSGRTNLAGSAYVDVDNLGGAISAVEHLASTGRRVIATVTGPQDMVSGRDRLEGYRLALHSAGFDHEDSLVEAGDFSEASGFAAVSALLDRRPDIDAIFAANDPMALGVLRALRGRGLKVPGDVAVVGFDGSSLSATSDPPLTTVAQPLAALGAALTDVLMRRIETPDEPVDPVILATELIVRTSA